MTGTAHSNSFDLVVIGAGIFGLSIATAGLKAALKVAVVEKDRVGAGASGGLLGALMPHMPARWNQKKQFQFQALHGLEDHLQSVEAETGVATGYRRCGRILPLTTQDKLDHHLERSAESADRWRTVDGAYSYQVEAPGSRSDWLAPDAAPFGIVYETLAARVSPRSYLKALAAFVRTHGTLLEGVSFSAFDEASGRLSTEGLSRPIASKAVVLAHGHDAYQPIADLTGDMIGRGEKGQAILLDGEGLADQPAIYCDGLYVVPHDDGSVAIGSTADRTYQDTAPDPARTEELLRCAIRFCPSLAGRDVRAAWAGIRPRCNKRDPMIGRLPDRSHTYAAVGGFKISFGIAHLIADALIAEIVGWTPAVALPDSFLPAHHFGAKALLPDET